MAAPRLVVSGGLDFDRALGHTVELTGTAVQQLRAMFPGIEPQEAVIGLIEVHFAVYRDLGQGKPHPQLF